MLGFIWRAIACSTHWLCSPTWIDFWLFIDVEVQLIFLIILFVSYKNVNYIFKVLRTGLLLEPKVTKTATPLIVTAVLNSTRAALTRATRSNRWPLDAVSLSTACSNLRMGCICCYYLINNWTVPQGRKGALAPLHNISLAKQTWRKKI